LAVAAVADKNGDLHVLTRRLTPHPPPSGAPSPTRGEG
jgi:hypothetical protein